MAAPLTLATGRALRSQATVWSVLWLALIGTMPVSSVSSASRHGPTESPRMLDMGESTPSGPMGGMDGPAIPPVHGFYAGTEILFIHTEASDQGVADLLTGMMGSPVLLVPSLAEVPAEALASVYVFTNGIQPAGTRGPLGFQPDVFDSAPGDETYTPLRAVALVTWADPARASILRSAAEVEAAIADGHLDVERPGVVVNMPFVTWPGGSR